VEDLDDTPEEGAVAVGSVRGKAGRGLCKAARNHNGLFGGGAAHGPPKPGMVGRLGAVQNIRKCEALERAWRAGLQPRSRVAENELHFGRSRRRLALVELGEEFHVFVDKSRKGAFSPYTGKLKQNAV